MSSVHSAGSLLAKITLQLHVFSFVLLQLTVTTEINGEKCLPLSKGIEKKIYLVIIYKEHDTSELSTQEGKKVSRSHLTRADIQF